jgi:hypothetical protein
MALEGGDPSICAAKSNAKLVRPIIEAQFWHPYKGR